MVREPSSPSLTRVDRFLLWARSNRFVSSLIILGIVLGGVATFSDSARRLAGLGGEIASALSGPGAEERATREKVKHAVELIDGYFTRAIEEQTLDFRPPADEEYEAMQSELRQLQVVFIAQKQLERARIVEEGMTLLKQIAPYGFMRPERWQQPVLERQQAEWRGIFAALGYEASAGVH